MLKILTNMVTISYAIQGDDYVPDHDTDRQNIQRRCKDGRQRDPEHPVEKGFPFDQAITHGIAKAFEGRSGETYFRYDIAPVKEEFEKLLKALQDVTPDDTAQPAKNGNIEAKLKQMLSAINSVLESGEVEKLYRLKADIADIYALLPKKD